MSRLDSSLEAYLWVDRSVLIQAHCVSEGFPADPALKRPRPAVRSPHMDLQPVRCGEHLWRNKWMKFLLQNVAQNLGENIFLFEKQ